MLLILAAAIALAAEPAGETQVSTDDVSVRIRVHSNIFTYTVQNNSDSPIERFQVGQHACYNFTAPEGWQKETSGDLYSAWSDTTALDIAPGRAAEFSMRVSSAGAVLGTGPAAFTFRSGRTVDIPDVWIPVPQPRSHIYLVAAVLVVILIVHFLLSRPRRSEPSAQPASAP